MKTLASEFNITEDSANQYCNLHKPPIILERDILTAGRAQLERKKEQYARLPTGKINEFFFTRPSACLLERIAVCLALKEPVLLVGETGTGKTSCVQYLARSTGNKLTVINMNQQSESADLLGGYKPVNLKLLISPVREEFEILFRTFFAIEPNKKYLQAVARYHEKQNWKTLVFLMNQSTQAALKKLRTSYRNCVKKQSLQKNASKCFVVKQKESNGQKHESQILDMLRRWETMLEKLNKLQLQVKNQHSLAFSFMEGSLIKALQNGEWVLLDEINLATAETLECLSGLLEGSSESLSLLERGDQEPIKRHPDFTLFACMNPATDVGKRDLPAGLRNRFTEFYVDELTERNDLQLLVTSYLEELNLSVKHYDSIVNLYLNLRKRSMYSLSDGTGHKPHYSLRTLCRALYITASNPCGSIQRSLYEAFSLSFLTQLDNDSYSTVHKMITEAFFIPQTIKRYLGTPIPKPKCSAREEYVYIEEFWIPQGSLMPEMPNNVRIIHTDNI